MAAPFSPPFSDATRRSISDFLVHILQVVVGDAETLEAVSVGQLPVGLVTGDFGHAHPVLLPGADTDGHPVFDINHGIGGDARFHQPPEEHVGKFLFRRLPPDLIRLAFVIAGRQLEIRPGPGQGNEGPLGDDPPSTRLLKSTKR